MITPVVPAIKKIAHRLLFSPQHDPEASVRGNTEGHDLGGKEQLPELSF